MNTIELHWYADEAFIGTDQKGHSVVIDGNKTIGLSPVELLLHALASCAAVDVVEIVRKQRATLHRLDIRVDGTRRDEFPRKYTAIHLTFTLRVDNLTMVQAERAVALALEKYCSVRASLDPAIPITTSIELNPST
jgi:putative redox protein